MKKKEEEEKSNLKRQKSTWVSPAEGGACLWCLKPWSR